MKKLYSMKEACERTGLTYETQDSIEYIERKRDFYGNALSGKTPM